MPRSKRDSKAFHFCKNIFLLLATCSNAEHAECNDCQQNTTYLAYDAALVRKRRPAKQSEVFDASRPSKQPKVVFNIGAHARTAKHKQHAFSNSGDRKRNAFTVDSGASVSVTNDLNIFETIGEIAPQVRVQVANKSLVQVAAIGTIRLNMVDASGKPYTILLRNVHYSPHFSSNLLSVNEMYSQHKIATTFKGGHAEFHTPDDVRIPFSLTDRSQYILTAYAVSPPVSDFDESMLWRNASHQHHRPILGSSQKG
mmetsp:Transcript_3749/g.8136  ORF Transcript_3749/g.8136 Transcript_3749/m.8136 type:complete len:255 (-) Transcript_3749:258-1022(-)